MTDESWGPDECWDRLREALTARVPYLRDPDVQNILDAIADEGLCVVDPKAPAYAPPGDGPEHATLADGTVLRDQTAAQLGIAGCATQRDQATWRGDRA